MGKLFAPLAGLVDPRLSPPVLHEFEAALALKPEARKQLDVARKLIAECGYHRRDEELAKLEPVIAGSAASPTCRPGFKQGRGPISA